MTNPLDSLRQGLQGLRKQVEVRKSRIEVDLKAGKQVSESDEEWIDGAGNIVDEQRVVENLENASDYERGLERLNPKDRGIVERLQVLTRSEALQAALTIQQYIQEIDDPFARKLEAMVSSFGRQTRLLEFQTLTTTHITDYFPRK